MLQPSVSHSLQTSTPPQLDPAGTNFSETPIDSNTLSETSPYEQTLSEYVVQHTETHTASNKRFRRFVEQSLLFNSTVAATHPKLIEWFHSQNDSLYREPSNFLADTGGPNDYWHHSDKDWIAKQEGYTQDMGQHKVWLV